MLFFSINTVVLFLSTFNLATSTIQDTTEEITEERQITQIKSITMSPSEVVAWVLVVILVVLFTGLLSVVYTAVDV